MNPGNSRVSAFIRRVAINTKGARGEERRLGRDQSPGGETLPIIGVSERSATARRYPEDAWRTARALAPHKPCVGGCGRGVGIPASFDHRHTLDERRIDRWWPSAKQLLVSADAFDPLR